MNRIAILIVAALLCGLNPSLMAKGHEQKAPKASMTSRGGGAKAVRIGGGKQHAAFDRGGKQQGAWRGAKGPKGWAGMPGQKKGGWSKGGGAKGPKGWAGMPGQKRGGWSKGGVAKGGMRTEGAYKVGGNRGNHYNGQWSDGNAHSNWDRGSSHQWHNHWYRWYDNGWLIEDSGYLPDSYSTGSIVVEVKEALAQRGYYSGRITPNVGPHTIQAISNYQADNGLPVSGQIDEPLLRSLGLN